MRVLRLISFMCALGGAVCFAEEVPFIEQYLDRSVKIESESKSTHAYYILAAQEDTPQELLNLLNDQSQSSRWEDAMFALGVIAGGDSEVVSLETLVNIADRYENINASSSEQLDLVEKAYWALAYQGSQESLAILKERASESYWNNRKLPSATEAISDPYTERVVTARAKAIMAIGFHPTPEAKGYLNRIKNESEFSNDKVLKEEIDSALALRSFAVSSHEERIKAYQVRNLGQQQTVELVEEPSAEIPAHPPAPEAVQVVEEVTPPEPAKEEPAEVVTVEVAEETAEQSSNWWLWLIGALVVVGGLGLVLRRKN